LVVLDVAVGVGDYRFELLIGAEAEVLLGNLDNLGVDIHGYDFGELGFELRAKEHGEETSTGAEDEDTEAGLFSELKVQGWSSQHGILVLTAKKVVVEGKHALLLLGGNRGDGEQVLRPATLLLRVAVGQDDLRLDLLRL
jgi:hypothetical protein